MSMDDQDKQRENSTPILRLKQRLTCVEMMTVGDEDVGSKGREMGLMSPCWTEDIVRAFFFRRFSKLIIGKSQLSKYMRGDCAAKT